MPDNAEIRVTTPGAKTAEGNLRKIADAEKKVGNTAKDAGRKGKRGGEEIARSHDKAARATGGLLSKISGLIKAYVGLRGAQMILAGITRETERLDTASIKAAKSLRAILALSSLKGERKEVQQRVYKMATFLGGADALQRVTPAYYSLMGGTSGMSTERREALMQQSLLMAKTDPSASLDAIVSLFSTIGTQQPGMSPVQIGNLVSRTIEQAKSTPSEMAAYLPSILTTARAGKVDVGTAAAMFSFTTRAGGGVAESGTAIRAAMMGLLAPSPDVAKQLSRYGFPFQGGLMERIEWLRTNGDKLPPELVAALGGRRGLEAIAAISENPGVFAAEVAGMQGAMGAEGSLLHQRLTSMYSEVPSQALYESIQQSKAVQVNEDIKLQNLARQASEERFRAYMRKRGTILPLRWGAEAMMWLGKVTSLTQPTVEEAREQARLSAERLSNTTVNIKHGGTDYHFENRENPAGKPRPARGH